MYLHILTSLSYTSKAIVKGLLQEIDFEEFNLLLKVIQIALY
jgi:hypothetical protein